MVKVLQSDVLAWIAPLPPLSAQTAMVECRQCSAQQFRSMTMEVTGSLLMLSERHAGLVTALVTGRIPLANMT